jgi:uncharacterized protein
MPDFGKALKRLPKPSLADDHPFAAELQFLRSRASRHAMNATALALDVLPPGSVESTPLGSHYMVRNVYSHDYFHGKVRLNRLCCDDLKVLMTLMRESGSVPDRDRIIFLDTETTGMQGGAGMCPFLVGVGFFVADEFQMFQYFIRDFDEEPSMLWSLIDLLKTFDLVVTYNGAAFDLPLLETRFTLARLDSPFASMSHFDLLFTTRRLWRNGHGSCRLTALEGEILSFMRGADIPGSMIPRAYFDHLQQRPNGTLKAVFTHNIYDVVSLAALTISACDQVTIEPAALDEPLDVYSLARVRENSSEWRRSIALYEMALAGGLPEPIRTKALENLCVVCRRAGDHERSRELSAALTAAAEFNMTGYEGAAIYYERVARDMESAIRIVEEALSRADSGRCKKILKSRWQRLQQKVLRYE